MTFLIWTFLFWLFTGIVGGLVFLDLFPTKFRGREIKRWKYSLMTVAFIVMLMGPIGFILALSLLIASKIMR